MQRKEITLLKNRLFTYILQIRELGNASFRSSVHYHLHLECLCYSRHCLTDRAESDNSQNLSCNFHLWRLLQREICTFLPNVMLFDLVRVELHLPREVQNEAEHQLSHTFGTITRHIADCYISFSRIFHINNVKPSRHLSK